MVRALLELHELLMSPDADLSLTSRPPGHKHTHTHQHSHTITQHISVFVVFGSEM